MPAQSKAQTGLRQWWSHPMTSLTLCAAIAFVGGMLIPDFSSVTRSVEQGVAANRGSVPPGDVSQPLAQTADYGTYQVQMSPGGQTVEVPVYSEFAELFRRDRNNPLFSRSGDGHANQVQWILVPVEGNRSMLIPVSEDTQLNMQ